MSEAAVRTPATPGVLDDPLRNRGVAFTAAEREALGLTGRLPSAVLTLAEQALRAYRQLQAQPDDLVKNVYLEQLHDRTALSPLIGYDKAAAISSYAINHNQTLKQAALANGVSEELFDRVVNTLALTRPGSADIPRSSH